RYGEVKTRLTIGPQALSSLRLTQKERGSSLRWSPSTVGALPGMCPNRSCGPRSPGFFPLGPGHGRRSVVVGALAVIGDVEAFALLLDRGTQAHDHVDDLVEDRRADARPQQRGQHGLALGD